MSPKVSLAVNVSAFICSSALIGIAVAAIYLASDAHESFTRKFNPSSYGWMPARWYNDGVGFSVLIGYNQSSVIKTYAAAAMSIVVGVTGIFAFGLSFKRPTSPVFAKFLLGGAAFAFIVTTICAVWSAVAEVQIKNDTCTFKPAIENHQYWCSLENAACNTMRFTNEVMMMRGDYRVLDRACLQFRHARYMVTPLAVLLLLLVALYAARIWVLKYKETENERANTRAKVLREHDEKPKSLLRA